MTVDDLRRDRRYARARGDGGPARPASRCSTCTNCGVPALRIVDLESTNHGLRINASGTANHLGIQKTTVFDVERTVDCI